jgi:hypothetical protein
LDDCLVVFLFVVLPTTTIVIITVVNRFASMLGTYSSAFSYLLLLCTSQSR